MRYINYVEVILRYVLRDFLDNDTVVALHRNRWSMTVGDTQTDSKTTEIINNYIPDLIEPTLKQSLIASTIDIDGKHFPCPHLGHVSGTVLTVALSSTSAPVNLCPHLGQENVLNPLNIILTAFYLP